MHMSARAFDDLLGWLGTGAILAAYGLITFNYIGPTSLVFLGLNGAGAAGLGYCSYRKKDYEPVVLNLVWIIIAIIGLVRVLFAGG